jgi:hypothetical protein
MRSAIAIPSARTGSRLVSRLIIAWIVSSASRTARRSVITIRERVIGGVCASAIVRRIARASVLRSVRR